MDRGYVEVKPVKRELGRKRAEGIVGHMRILGVSGVVGGTVKRCCCYMYVPHRPR